MRFSIDSSKVQGELAAPTSKSYTHRAIIVGALSNECIIRRPLLSADTLATVAACEKFGAKIELINGDLHITGIKGKPCVPDDVIDVKNSGTTLRLMTAISSLADGATVLTGDSSIRGRPNQPLIDALNKLNVEVFSTRNNGCAPIVVKGRLKGSTAEIDGSMSSQFISALLMACPLAMEDTILTVKGQMKSRPYVDITIEILSQAGVRILVDEMNGIRFIVPSNQKYDLIDYIVPGDFSSASYLLAAAAMLGSYIIVRGLFPSKQGDSKIIDVLRQMGADVHWDVEKGIVTVKQKTLKGIRFDAGATPDLVPTVAVLAAVAEGVTVIGNAKHVRYKETDRLHAMAVELSKMGIMVKEEPDSLIITGGKPIGADLHGWHDHRIVMALTLAGMVAGNTTIDTVESVSISYPDFFEEMKSIGAKIETLD